MGLNYPCIPVVPVMDSGYVDRTQARIKTGENMKSLLAVASDL